MPLPVRIVETHHSAAGIFSFLKTKVTFASLSSICSAPSDLLCLASWKPNVYFIHKHQTAHSAPATSVQEEAIGKNLAWVLLGEPPPAWNLTCGKHIACLLAEGVKHIPDFDWVKEVKIRINSLQTSDDVSFFPSH